MFHPESNPLAPKSTGPKKPEKELVRVWLGDAAAAEMDNKKPEAGDEEDLNSKKHELTEQEKRKLWEMRRPGEVVLRNVPDWKVLPGEGILRKEFSFDRVREDYRKGRPLSDFKPRPEETSPSFQAKEALPHAKVFDIGDAIARARKKDPEHDASLTTAEVLEAIDQAGYCPATLRELLAYARDYWKPDVDPKTLTKEERELQNAQAPWIVSLNSAFSNAAGLRRVPTLFCDGAERELDALDLGRVWYVHVRFLVLRKAFPS